MKEIQIRNINQREANKITDLLFIFCYGENEPRAYKNEYKEEVTEFVFSGFNEDNIKKIKKLLKD